MKKIKTVILTAALAGLGFSAASAASLTGVASGLNAASERGDSGIQNVHWRDHRHCHWHDGERDCHYGYRSYGYSSFAPGYGLYLNLGRRHHHRDWDDDRQYRNWRYR